MIATHRPDFQLFIDRLTRRSVLSAEEQREIRALPATMTTVRGNRDFVRVGETVDHASLIVDGLVGSFGQTSEGHRQIVAVHLPGDMIDLRSIVAQTGSSPIQILSDATILRVPRSALRSVARRFPAIAEAFWRDSAVDNGILAQWVVNVGRRDARSRLAHLLCEMAERYDAIEDDGDGEAVRFHLPMTQSHLADATGMTSVHVNRTLQALRAAGIVAFSRRSVTIFDWHALSSIADFDPAYLQNAVAPQPFGEPAANPSAQSGTLVLAGQDDYRQ